MTRSSHGPLRVGIGGPVGSGKTALMEALCKRSASYDIAAITNDIYTKEDARLLTVAGALPEERIMGVETGGCPHTAIREDCSINLAAIDAMNKRFPALDLILLESGGDNLAATFSPELADITVYVIDVVGRREDPPQGRAGDHPIRPAGHQQDRPRAIRRGRPRRNGPRFQADAPRQALCLRQYEDRGRRRRRRQVHRSRRWAGAVLARADVLRVSAPARWRACAPAWPTRPSRPRKGCLHRSS